MLEQMLRLTLLLTIACSSLSGCGYMTKQGRQQIAYQHYIKKCSGRKMKQVRRVKAPHMPLTPGPSENKINAEVTSAPQSVTSGESATNE
jgi:hypothetical protein